MKRRSGGILAGIILIAAPAGAQQYRFRVDTRFQSVSFRGVELDSVLQSQTVAAPSGGRETVDGFSVHCGIGAVYCSFFRPGGVERARPAVTSIAGTAWGLGLPGLSLRADARVAVDLGESEVWPGTKPAVQLLEAYAEYAMERITGRVGRQVYVSRLGFTGFDGVRASARMVGHRLEIDAYLGWGLGRGSALPVTSDALNPLDDFQPRQRQLVAGASLGWNHSLGSVRLDYQREVDPRSDYFVSERAALAANLVLPAHFSVEAGSEYDIATAQWGSSDMTVRYHRRSFLVSAGFQRYLPHFDLWTIWGAFSPVGYSGINGAVAFSPLKGLSLRARGARTWFDETETETPLVSVEDRGWQLSLGGSYAVRENLSLAVDHSTEFGPGGSYTSLGGSASYLPVPALTLSLQGGRLNRPLEFRFDEATLYHVGIDAGWRLSERWQGSFGATRFFEERDRPDAAAFDWGQTRITARLSVLLGNGSDRVPLPPAVRGTAGEPRQ